MAKYPVAYRKGYVHTLPQVQQAGFQSLLDQIVSGAENARLLGEVVATTPKNYGRRTWWNPQISDHPAFGRWKPPMAGPVALPSGTISQPVKSALRTSAFGLSRAALRFGGRLVPPISIALTLLDVVELVRWSSQLLGTSGLTPPGNFTTCFNHGGDIARWGSATTCQMHLELLGSQAGPAGDVVIVPGQNYNWTSGSLYYSQFDFWAADGSPRYRVMTQFRTNPGTAVAPAPGLAPGAAVGPPVYPMVHPSVDAMAMPIGQPTVTPRPLPYRLLHMRVSNPFRIEQSERGYSVEPRPDELGQKVYVTKPLPSGRGGVTIPPVVITNTHIREPPGPGNKERKVRRAPWMSFALNKMVNPVTEGLDILDAFYYAIPEEVRKKNHYGQLPQEKLQFLYLHWQDVVLTKALENLALAQIQDMILGQVGKRLGERAREQNRPIGYQAGPAL